MYSIDNPLLHAKDFTQQPFVCPVNSCIQLVFIMCSSISFSSHLAVRSRSYHLRSIRVLCNKVCCDCNVSLLRQNTTQASSAETEAKPIFIFLRLLIYCSTVVQMAALTLLCSAMPFKLGNVIAAYAQIVRGEIESPK